MALSYNPGRGRARQRHMEGRFVEARRRARLGDRILRSRTEHDVLGHKQPGSAALQSQSRKRQPEFRLTGCTRSGHGKAEMSFPVSESNATNKSEYKLS